MELNFFITIDTQHLNKSYLDHQWKKKNQWQWIKFRGAWEPRLICKSAWREKNDVNLYIAESHCNPSQHSIDQSYTVGQTRLVENTTHRIKAYLNSAQKKVNAVSVLITSFTVGLYHIYFEAGSWRHEWNTDNNRHGIKWKAQLFPQAFNI